jgi:LacI family transcriptional regulator
MNLRVTIKKIADVAKVSRGTVDKVLNNRPGVSDEVRKRVMEIIDALEYKPNIIGKALANQKKPSLIGMIIPSDANPFFNDIRKGVEAAYQELSDFGVKIDCRVMNSLDVEEQLSIIKYLSDQGISALALTAIDNPAICNAINTLVAQNIPVVTFNSDITGSKRMCFIGQDLVKSGRVAGELLGKILQGKGQIAVITGSHHILAHNQRVDGFKMVINKDFPGIEIVDTIENLDQDALSFELTWALLEKFPNLNGIFIAAGGISGAGKAVKLAGKGNAIKMICTDFIPNTIELVKEGVIDFAIGQDPFTQGYQLVKILYDCLFLGRGPEKEFFYTKIDIRIKENIESNLI